MPDTTVILYKEDGDTVPLLNWLGGLPAKARVKCIARIIHLKRHGHQLRRPEADYLRDDIYELRVALQHVNYRMLYFFHGRTAAVLSHGLVKEGRIPPEKLTRPSRAKPSLRRIPRPTPTSWS